MPKKYTVTLYAFDELSDEAKKKAIAWRKKQEELDPNPEQITEMICEHLHQVGYPHNQPRPEKTTHRRDREGTVEWSLSNCQGDGVAFYGPVDIPVVLNRLRKDIEALVMIAVNQGGLKIWIERNSSGHHYSHPNTMNVEFEWNDDYVVLNKKAVSDAVAAFVLDVKTDVRAVSKELEQMGYRDLEYKFSDEYMIECLKDGDEKFYVSGRYADVNNFDEEPAVDINANPLNLPEMSEEDIKCPQCEKYFSMKFTTACPRCYPNGLPVPGISTSPPQPPAQEKKPCERCGDPDATFEPDPYSHDIHGDDTPVWMCDPCRDKSADDV